MTNMLDQLRENAQLGRDTSPSLASATVELLDRVKQIAQQGWGTSGAQAALAQINRLLDGDAPEPNPALPADPLDGWEGMESAPKDGTRVLALVTQKQFYRDTQTPNELIPVVVRWGGEYQEWSMPGLGGLRPTLWKSIELSEKSPTEPNAHEAFRAFARRYGLSRETVVAIAQDLPTYDTLKANALKSNPPQIGAGIPPDGAPSMPLCDGEVRVIYEHGEPTGVRDTGGYLCFFNRVSKWEGQEDRYRNELALRARQAEAIANALRTNEQS